MEISRKYRAHDGNYTAGGNACRFVVVHYTGNSASAEAEARYASNDQHPSSYHYVLDGRECYQILDDTDTAWAVGAWSGAKQLIGNAESVSVEVCNDGGPFDADEQAMLRELVRILMERHGVPAERVVRHWDCHTGRKQCPAWYAGAGNEAWASLHAYITKEDDMPTAREIADAVWLTDINGVNACDRLQGTDAAANRAAKEATRTDDPTGRGKKLNDHDHIKWLAKELADTRSKVDVLDAKLDAIMGALGAGDVKIGGTD